MLSIRGSLDSKTQVQSESVGKKYSMQTVTKDRWSG